MADEHVSTFSLDTLTSLSKNPEDIYRALAYFEAWRPYFSESLRRLTKNLDENIAPAYSKGDTELMQKLFTEFLDAARILPTKEGIFTRQTDAPPTESRIRNLGEALKTSQVDSLKAQEKHIGGSRRRFIEDLVKNYATIRPEVVEKIISETIDAAKSDPAKTPSKIIREIVERTSPDISKKPIQHIEAFVEKTIKEEEKFHKVVSSSILSSPEPDITAGAILDILSSPTSDHLHIEDVVAHANGVTAGSIALSESPDIQSEIVSKVKNEFFSVLSKTPLQKNLLAPLADIASTLLGKDKVIEYLYEQTVKDLATRFGKSFALFETKTTSVGTTLFSSEAFRNLITEAQKHIGDKTGAAPTLLSPARGFIDSFIRPIFGKPLEESTLAYMHAIYIEKIPVSVALQQYYLIPTATPRKSSGFLSWIFQFGAEKGTGALANAGMKKAVGMTVEGAVKTGVTAASITIFGWAPPAWLAAAILWIGGKVIMPVARFIFGGIKSLFGGAITRLMTGGFESEEGKRELLQLSLIAGIPILVVVIFYVLPSPLNLVSQGQMQNDLAFINEGIDGIGGGGYGEGYFSGTTPEGIHAPLVDCDANPGNPLCQLNDCSSPVMATMVDGKKRMWAASGSITQGPSTGCGGTHRNLSAIDIGASSRTPVYATTKGTIIDINSVCTDNVKGGCGGGYGNFVLIRSDDGYTLTFGHLMQSSLSSLKEGMRVDATTSIGRVDDNGNSTGPHLHFGYKGLGTINDILPAAIPDCVNNTSGCASCGYPVTACIQ